MKKINFLNIKTIKIELKNNITTKSLKRNLMKLLFDNNELKGLKYITILTKFALVKEDVDLNSNYENKFIYRNLSSKFVLDLDNKKDKKDYIENLINKFDKKFLSAYDPNLIKQILFVYNEVNINEYSSFRRRIENRKTFIDTIKLGIKPYLNIPFNTFYESWGDVKIISKIDTILSNIKFNTDIEYIKISEYITYNKIVEGVIVFKSSDKENVNFRDSYTKDGNLRRDFTLNNKKLQSYLFNLNTSTPVFYMDRNVLPIEYKKDEKGNPILSERVNVIKKTLNYTDKMENAFKKGKLYVIPEFKAITLDIETYIVNNYQKLLCICFYDGVNTYKYYRNDYSSDNIMLRECFNQIFISKYKNYKIYIHNGSNFDLIFLLEYLLNRQGIIINPLYKDGQFLSLNIKYEVKTKDKSDLFDIYIHDSYLLLTSSLSKLCKAFNVENQKDIFPYYFVNEHNLDYIGAIPSYTYFESSKVSILEYKNYSNRFINKEWNLKDEVLQYCELDCISLYQVLNEFKKFIDEQFEINIQDCPTITSLAFKIFKSNFYSSDNNLIPLLSKELYKELEPWFFGGHCDMYVPSGPYGNGDYIDVINKLDNLTDKSTDNIKKEFNTIKHYDVNSLYPSVMKDFKYPTDIIGKFIGDIKNTDFFDLYDHKLGIYLVEVFAPDIKHPLLPVRTNTTIYGYGNWTGMYFSDEIKNAEKYGYKFKILGGFLFESSNIFKDYIETLYTIKESSSKDEPMYLISKILMNGLYGRFAINPWLSKCEFITKPQYKSLIESGILKSSEIEEIEFSNHYLIQHRNNDQFGIDAYLPISIAVTAYARILMSTLKNRDDINLYYTDTDSVFIDEYLPNDMVDNKIIGKWKLENEYIYSIFLAPKLYACLSINGDSYSKVKGYKKTVGIDILSKLLNKSETVELTQSKWFNRINESTIEIKVGEFEIKPTDNKRDFVYLNDKLVGTKNIKIRSTDVKEI